MSLEQIDAFLRAPPNRGDLLFMLVVIIVTLYCMIAWPGK